MSSLLESGCVGTPTDEATSNGNGEQVTAESTSPEHIRWPEADHPKPPIVCEPVKFVWDEDAPLDENCIRLGDCLAAGGDLYRNPKHGDGVLFAPMSQNISPKPIKKAADLAPIIADRMRVTVVKKGKPVANTIPDKLLAIALRAEVFLQQFRPLDAVVTEARFLEDFSITTPGYNDGGTGQRVLYVGPPAAIADDLTATNRFLDEMAWAGDADRANALAGALTVLLRNHWLGAKPAIVATANKSHSGKDTIVAFATGNAKSVSISYQTTDWALERCFVGACKTNPDAGVIVIENARLGRGIPYIASAFLERVLTDPEPQMFSTGTGAPVRRPNDIVVAISTNDGKISNDLMNRALPIHLEPVGDVHRRKSSIGNPKLEYLPAHRDQIEIELRGLINRWVEAGKPLDDTVQHPFTGWAQTIGGILKVAEVAGFLGNYNFRRTEDDPVRQALGLLGVARPNTWLRTGDWVSAVAELGLIKRLIPEADRDSREGQRRGLGVVLSAHEDEIFEAATEDFHMTVKLKKARKRFDGDQPTTRYQFKGLDAQPVPMDPE